MLRSARRYSQNAYATAEPRVEGMTREEATIAFQKKIILLARQIGERLPSDSSLCVEDLVSYGAIGLLEAFDRFIEKKNFSKENEDLQIKYRLKFKNYLNIAEKNDLQYQKNLKLNQILQPEAIKGFFGTDFYD